MFLDSYLSAITILTLGVALSVVGLILVRQKVHIDSLMENHEVGGYMLSVVGTMYAVLLGLVVVDAMARFQEARTIVEQEANSLADVFVLSRRFPEEKQKKIESLCLGYVTEVVQVEWAMMDDAQKSPKARKMCFDLIHEVIDYEPVTESQKAVYPLAVEAVCNLWENRRARTNISDNGMPIEEWVVLVLGAAVCSAFAYFFGLRNLKAQMIMTALCSTLIALNLFLVLMFGYPFSGDMKIRPDALYVDKLIFERMLGTNNQSEM
jgi:hypothetical protein